MGEKDLKLYEFIGDNRRFADLFNGCFFKGEQVISEGDLCDASEKYVTWGEKGRPEGRTRDVCKYYTRGGVTLQILAEENQTFVDYTMPVRHMEYDIAEYRKQLHKIRKRNKSKDRNRTAGSGKEKEAFESAECNGEERGFTGEYRSAEWLCGFKQTDHLIPVFTIVLYTGEAPWNGARSLRDMMDFSGEPKMKKWFNDYSLHLVCINEISDSSCFKTDLKEFVRMLNCRNDRTKLRELVTGNDEYRELSPDTARILADMTGMNIDLTEVTTEGGKVNMCKAVEDLFNEGIEIGEARGIEMGEARGMCALVAVLKKLPHSTIDSIYQMVTDEPMYANVTRQQIEELYNA